MSEETQDQLPPKSRLKDLFDLLTVSLAIIAVIATLGSLAARHNWIADLLANLRIQQVIGLAVVFLMSLVVRRWKFAVICFACLIYHGTWLCDWNTASLSSTTKGSSALTVTTVNVWSGNVHHDLILDNLNDCDADVFAVLELNSNLATVLVETFSESHPHSVVRPSDTGEFWDRRFFRNTKSSIKRSSLSIPKLSRLP